MLDTALFLSHLQVANNPSLVNLIDLLAEAGRLDIFYAPRRTRQLRCREVDHPRVRRFPITIRHLGWQRLRHAGRGPRLRYDVLIACDPHGLVLCDTLYPTSRPFYYSLELYLLGQAYNLLYPDWIRRLETRKLRDIRGLIIQSEERARLLLVDHGLDATVPTFHLPVTYRGPALHERTEALRQTYGIPPESPIALHLGGIAPWYECAEIAAAFARVPAWHLLFQGHQPAPGYGDVMRTTISRHGLRNVHLSRTYFREVDDVFAVVSGADAGIAWYPDHDANFRSAGFSSGKISAYCRAGLPILAKRNPSTRQVVEESGSGLCIDSLDELPGALDMLHRKRDEYGRSSRAAYERWFQFDRYRDPLLRFLRQHA